VSGELSAADRAGPTEHPPRSYDVIVVGAGQAGLAMGYYLSRQGLRFLILDAAAAVGAAWHERWDSLVLFTPARYSGLPGLPFPGDRDHYPRRDEVIAYLERYAERFRLPIALDSPVTSISPRDGRYAVVAGGVEYEADQVVVATGPFQVPWVPPIAEDLAPDVVQMHSTGYRSPRDVPAGPVLVVGGGNTGFQIAEELSRTHDVHLSIGSRQPPLPQRFLGRDLFWWLTALGLMRVTVDSPLGRRMKGRDTLVGSSPRKLGRRGVTIQPRAVGTSGNTVTFADGTDLRVVAVIWATGYRLDLSWIDVPKGADGTIPHRRGVTSSPGLYLLGLSWLQTRGSALIGWVGGDAELVARRIAERRAGRLMPSTARL
jgi:putative flavoprotein involved in K+ transport